VRAGPHAGVKKPHQRVEAIFIRRDDEATQRIGKQCEPRGLTLLAPGGVRRALGAEPSSVTSRPAAGS